MEPQNSSLPSDPTETFGRYQLLSVCGEGGMGRVYRAYDTQLKRVVALKFMRDGDGDGHRRFVREAQSQARLDHPNVCRIFDAGEVDGRPYIAMQFIDGAPLHEVSRSLSTREKVQVMRDVALALEAAHSNGLLHRDVKPGNILVARRGEEWWPYVVDFGLARDTAASATTTAGILGTPHYISPEQAWGSKVDARTDVYGLGATMYELFTGTRAFEGDKSLDVIVQVLHRDPLPPRRLRPDLPPDLETIVLKCLEKEPERRYASARAVAEDLQRFLDGEPISARPTGAVSRTIRKVRRNRPLLVTLIAATVLLIVASSAAAYREYQSRYEARLSADFQEEIRYIEEFLRHAYSLPLHDVRSEEAAMRARLKQLEARVQKLGRRAHRPGEFALGSGYLALSDATAARRHLENARKAGHRTPATAYALGRALTLQYEDRLNEAQRISDPALRRRTVQQIDDELRVPALRYLAASRGAHTRSPELDAALLAYHAKRFDDSLTQTARALKRLPWLNEARILRAQVLRSAGNQKRDTGDTRAAALSYASAREEYGQAIRFAPSDSRTYTGLCGAWTDHMTMEFHSTGADQKPYFTHAVAACENALAANPDNADAWMELAEAYTFWGAHLQRHARDPTESLDKAVAAAERAINLEPNNAYAYYSRGQAYWWQTVFTSWPGRDRAALEKAERSYRRAMQLDPSSPYFVTSLGNIYLARGYGADHPGQDPRPFWRKAAETYEQAISVDPTYVLSYDRAGVAYRHIGFKTWTEGGDPRPFLQKSIDVLRRGVAVNPATASLYDNLGEAHLYKGEYELSIGEDPSETLRQSDHWYREAVARNPNSWETYWTYSLLKIVQGRAATARGENPEALFDESVRLLDRAVELFPTSDGVYYTIRGRQYLWRAEWLRKSGRDYSVAVDAGIRDIETAFARLKSPIPAHYALAGALYALKAISRPTQRQLLLRKSQQHLDTAFSRQPMLRREFGHFADQFDR